MTKATVATTNPATVEIEYDTFGDPADPAVLLIMGFTVQLIGWDDALCELLADGGRFVIRFDNRDCGLSTKFDGARADPLAVLAAAMAGKELPPVPYTLSDMANDSVGLLDELGIDKAHVVGASMGGMIAQTVAIEHAERVVSLTSIMSTTGNPAHGKAAPEAMAALLAPPPTDRAAFIEASARAEVWASRRYADRDRLRQRAADEFDRRFYPHGAARQLAAIYASGNRSEALSRLDIPTLVIHGRDDTLITPSGGEHTASLVPGASLMLVDDMGHDLPPALWPTLVAAILDHQETAAARL